MMNAIVSSTLRLTLDGVAGRVDVAVPAHATTAVLRDAYAEATGHAAARMLAPTGRPWPDGRSLTDLGLRHGDLVIAQDEVPDLDHPEPTVTASAPDGSRASSLVPLAAVLAFVAAATVAATADSAVVRSLLAVALLAVPIVALIITGLRDRPAWAAAMPAVGGSAAIALVGADSVGGPTLTAGVAALTALAVAALWRAGRPGVADDVLGIWMCLGGALAIASGIDLLADAHGWVLWPLALTFGLVALRMLPSWVVDVPDDLLIDFKRLAITAWSAREEPRKVGRHTIVTRRVEDLVDRGRRLLAAASVAVAAVAVLGTAVLVGPAPTRSQHIGGIVLCVCVGMGLSLGSRHIRDTRARIVLAATGGLVLAAVGWSLVADASHLWRAILASGAIAAGLLTVVAARALGRGWQSVWWARVGEILDTLAVVGALAALPAAVGLVETLRTIGS